MTKAIKIVSYKGSFGEGKSYGLMTSREMLLSADSMDAYVSLFGLNDQNIALIEQECGVTTALRGNKLVIQGEEDRLDLPEQVIETLLSMIRRHEYVDRVRIRYVIAMIREGKKEQIEETFKNRLLWEDILALGVFNSIVLKNQNLYARIYGNGIGNHSRS